MIRLIFIVLFSFSTLAACPSLDIQNLPTSYDFQNDLTPRFNFRVTRDDRSEECDFAIGIDKGGSTNYNRFIAKDSDQINYNLSKRNSHNSTLKDVNDQNNSDEILEGEFKADRGPSFRNLRFFGRLSLPQNPISGYYSDTLSINLYEKNGATYNLVRSRPLTLFYNVPDLIFLSIVSRGGGFDSSQTSQSLNFGNLSTGSVRGVDVVIQTSAGYTLNVSSENNGQLKHSETNAFVNYLFRSNGATIGLSGTSSSPILVQAGTGNHPSDGFRFEFDFEIGSISGQPAGNYSDRITVTVTTNL